MWGGGGLGKRTINGPKMMSKSFYLDPELAVGGVPHRPERPDAVEALGELADDDVARHQDPALLDVVAEATSDKLLALANLVPTVEVSDAKPD